MKIAHLAVVTPGRCGLYETTRELAYGLRSLKIDARLVDPTKDTNSLHPEGTEDRGVPFANMDWAVTADLLVNHSGYDNTPVEHTDQPIIHVSHGRPRSSYLTELNGGTPGLTWLHNKNYDPRWKAIVTFWPEHLNFLEFLCPDVPRYYVPPPVDDQYWRPGPGGYDFGGHAASQNYVCVDAWRDDLDPFEAVCAAALDARKEGATKVHIYGKTPPARPWAALLARMRKDGTLGETGAWLSQGQLRDVYRSSDRVYTSNTIAVRTAREALACGTLVWNNSLSSVKGAPPRETALEFVTMLADVLPAQAA